MGATSNSGLGHGTGGAPQKSLEEQLYPTQVDAIEESLNSQKTLTYTPSPKHDAKSGWGSENPITSQAEGQFLLETGYHNGKQIYNITSDGKIVKFQPDGSSNNGYHAYEIFGPPDIPSSVLRQMLNAGKISKAQYNKLRKGKK